MHELLKLSGDIHRTAQRAHAEHQTRLFWPTQFGTGHDLKTIVEAFRVLDAQGAGTLLAEFTCPKCQRQWEYRFNGLPKHCRNCGISLEQEEVEVFFSFELATDDAHALVVNDAHLKTVAALRGRVAWLEAQWGEAVAALRGLMSVVDGGESGVAQVVDASNSARAVLAKYPEGR